MSDAVPTTPDPTAPDQTTPDPTAPQPTAASGRRASAGGRHPVLRYTAWRLVLLLAVWAVLWIFPVFRGLLGLVLALLVSGSISLFLLDRQRDSMSGAVSGFFGRLNARIDASTRAEDEDEEDLPPQDSTERDGDPAQRPSSGAGSNVS